MANNVVFFPTGILELDMAIVSYTDLPTCLRVKGVNRYCQQLCGEPLLVALFCRLAPHLTQKCGPDACIPRPELCLRLREYHPNNRWLEIACHVIPGNKIGVIPSLFREAIPGLRRVWEAESGRHEARIAELNGAYYNDPRGLLAQAWAQREERAALVATGGPQERLDQLLEYEVLEAERNSLQDRQGDLRSLLGRQLDGCAQASDEQIRTRVAVYLPIISEYEHELQGELRELCPSQDVPSTPPPVLTEVYLCGKGTLIEANLGG